MGTNFSRDMTDMTDMIAVLEVTSMARSLRQESKTSNRTGDISQEKHL